MILLGSILCIAGMAGFVLHALRSAPEAVEDDRGFRVTDGEMRVSMIPTSSKPLLFADQR